MSVTSFKKIAAPAVEPLTHILIWGYGTFLVLNDKLFSLDYLHEAGIPIFYPVLLGTACNAGLFYMTSFYLMPEYLGKGRAGKFLVWLSVSIVAVTLIETSFDLLIGSVNTSPDTAGHFGASLLVSIFFIHLLFVLFAFLYRSGKDWIRNEKIKRQLIEDKLSAELNFLKAQINPHFLFNTLNSLYSMALGTKPETAAGIAKLSHLMRYMIYESKERRVPLTREIRFLENYIELQKLRSVASSEDSEITIEFKKRYKDEPVTIAPMLLIPLVENAFKHGISMVESSEIFIVLEMQNGVLNLSIKNTSPVTSSAEAGGVGLKNLKRRLELLYPGQYDLDITEKKGCFYTHFQLGLNHEH